MKNNITVSYTGNHFVLVDPDTKKSIIVDPASLIGKKYFVTSAIERHFLSLFPGKTECQLTPDASAEMTQIADWNNVYE